VKLRSLLIPLAAAALASAPMAAAATVQAEKPLVANAQSGLRLAGSDGAALLDCRTRACVVRTGRRVYAHAQTWLRHRPLPAVAEVRRCVSTAYDEAGLAVFELKLTAWTGVQLGTKGIPMRMIKPELVKGADRLLTHADRVTKTMKTCSPGGYELFPS
jgi:hypothetical protein